jgi:hypothetical protein
VEHIGTQYQVIKIVLLSGLGNQCLTTKYNNEKTTMRKQYKTITTLFILLLFISCERDIELPYNYPPTLCFNCILNPDSIITASLTYVRNIDTIDTFIGVNNAKIILTENGVKLEQLTNVGKGKYKLNYKPKPQKRYTVTVTYLDFLPLTAETVVPVAPVVTHNVDTVKSVQNPYEPYIITNINFAIVDKIGLDRYWYYVFGRNRNMSDFWPVHHNIYAPFFDDFNRYVDADNNFSYSYYIRINDEGYDGQVLKFTQNNVGKRLGESSTTFYFLTADKHYDKYIKTTVKDRVNKEEDFSFLEPVQIYTNIENGYGIFGSCAITIVKF